MTTEERNNDSTWKPLKVLNQDATGMQMESKIKK